MSLNDDDDDDDDIENETNFNSENNDDFVKMLFFNGKDDEDDNSDQENTNEDGDADSEIDEKHELFINKIKNLCINHIHCVPHTFIDKLLNILRENTDAPFPKIARTLLSTPRFTEEVYNMDSDENTKGEYCHYGLKNAVISFLVELGVQNIDNELLEIIVNIDGAPLGKSSEKGMWIIACSETYLKAVEIVGIYYGNGKPKDCNILLSRFQDEMNELIENGVEYNNKKYSVKFYCLNCDAPAKAYVLNTKLHSGYFSCSKCIIKSDYDDKVYFPPGDHPARTDEGFKNYEYTQENSDGRDGYQKGETLLADIFWLR